MRFFTSNIASITRSSQAISALAVGACSTILSAAAYIGELNSLYNDGKELGIQDAKQHAKYQLSSNYKPDPSYSQGDAITFSACAIGLPLAIATYILGRAVHRHAYKSKAQDLYLSALVTALTAPAMFGIYSLITVLFSGQDIGDVGYYYGYQATCPASGAESCIGGVKDQNAGRIDELPSASLIASAVIIVGALPAMILMSRIFGKLARSKDQEMQGLLQQQEANIAAAPGATV